MSRHRMRPRYGRIALLAGSVAVTMTAVLGGLGVLVTGTAEAGAVARDASYHPARSSTQARTQTPGTRAEGERAPGKSAQPYSKDTPAAPGAHRSALRDQTSLPASTGSGRRVVFSQHLQRVWLVGGHDDVRRTYLVSGSTTDNLQPGTYAITNRERHAIGIDDSGTMQYFDIFTAGPTGAAIGFHSIPVKNGHLVQTMAQLGTPQSHGCIRQWMPDAVALWKFAPIGTKVVVVA